ncbi:MAG TPA: isochorismate synthase [Rubrivivax sp.]|nr:isochorismate synthase [Rubrivivax sp.]
MNAALLTDCALQLCSAAIEVTPLPPERLLAMAADPVAVFIPPGGDAGVGLGAARWLEPGQADAAALWAGLLDESPDAPAPAALGALPFSEGEAPDAVWRGLMPGGVMLPERLYVQQGARAWWRLTLPLREAATLPARLARDRISLAALSPAETQPLTTWHALGEGGAPAHFAQAVEQAVQRIRGGEIVKVVLARRAAVAFDTPPEPAALLARLGQRHPDCVRYAWQRGGKTWLGATPETLVQVQGRTLRTHALAGTRSAERAGELLASAKDRHENAIVVDAIRQAVAALTQALPPEREPVVRRLRGLAHLHTPIEATLRADTDFLRLVHALHPTPAVCGVPAARASALLAALEPEPRGLYAGPFVRLSPYGDGHAVVSLRGTVVDGRMAVLPAGAGIVEGSDGEAELAETRVKQLSVLDAFLGSA